MADKEGKEGPVGRSRRKGKGGKVRAKGGTAEFNGNYKLMLRLAYAYKLLGMG